MSLRICYLAVYVFAITVSGTIKAIGAVVAKDPHRLSDYFAEARETTLSSLVGRFIVVGSQPVTGKTYRGSVVVTREGNSLQVRELIDGKPGPESAPSSLSRRHQRWNFCLRRAASGRVTGPGHPESHNSPEQAAG